MTITQDRPRLITPLSPAAFSDLVDAVEAAHQRKTRAGRSSARRRRQRRECCGALTKLVTVTSAVAWAINMHSRAGATFFPRSRAAAPSPVVPALDDIPLALLPALLPAPAPAPATATAGGAGGGVAAGGEPLKMTLAFDPGLATHLAKAAPMALYYYGRGTGGNGCNNDLSGAAATSLQQWQQTVGWGGAAAAFVLWGALG